MRTWMMAGWILLAGCASVVAPPEKLSIEPSEMTPWAATEAWGRVLDTSVDWRGQVDIRKIADSPRDLHLFIAFIAQYSPKSHPKLFPTLEDETAFYINSYNALVLYGMVLNEFPRDFNSAYARNRFFRDTQFRIGGEDLSLLEYENRRIRPLGDARVHFALTPMVRSGPRLAKEPYEGDRLEQQLDAAAHRFINDPGNVLTLENEEVVRLSEMFQFYEEDFLQSANAPSLIAYVNRYRKKKIQEPRSVQFIPFDWMVRYW